MLPSNFLELFQSQVESIPNLPALEFNGQVLTYLQLDQRVNQVANRLLCQGLTPEARVGLCVDRSIEMIVGMLGILKAGGAYVPLDPTYPVERLTFMLADSGAPILLTQESHREKFPEFHDTVICLDSDWKQIERESDQGPNLKIASNQLAYIIYTSGSTGQPKGVMIEHGGWVNYCRSAQAAFDLRPGERVLQFSSFSWDTSAEEIFPTLASGATLVLRTADLIDSFTRFWDAIANLGVTVLSLPTAFWHELVGHLSLHAGPWPGSLRVVFIGGERALPAILRQWHEIVPMGIQLFNTYGQTECTAVTTRCLLEPSDSDSVPIGRAVENVNLKILNEHGLPASQGELYVGGAGLGRGYLNQPDLTAQKFITLDGMRHYRTGDLVRVDESGMLFYQCRADEQLKIRGVRIEPGEVEAALVQHPEVKLAAVVGHPPESPRALVAYVVPHGPVSEAPRELRVWLKAYLPEALLPSAVVALATLPLTPNGKLDRRALPAPESVVSEVSESDQPRDSLETHLLAIWKRLLKREDIGIHDNFFEKGGDSLLVVMMITELENELQHSLPLALIFHAPTIADLAVVLRDRGWKPRWCSLVPIQPRGSKPPLFCVHADGGTFFYTRFAPGLSPDQPFYGLQARGLDGLADPFCDLREMAAHYIREIRTVQQRGPYRLGGFSVGGVIIYEMAQQLLAQGEQVSLLAFLDAPAPDYPVYVKAHPLTRKLRNFLQLETGERWTHVARRLGQRLRNALTSLNLKLHLRLKWTLTPELRIFRVRQLNQSMGDSYRPKPYTGPIHVFYAMQQPLNIVDDCTLGWGKYVRGPIYCEEVPGDHESIFQLPNVIVLARSLQKRLDAISDFIRESTEKELSPQRTRSTQRNSERLIAET
ncbi:MAG: amino acid adenylation domain-containing protein [Anaerolineaceae bacterium]|nr:MAG: amino acid adenylation domain-containing protein [Anaerolineaceae bacterium]